MDSIYYGVLERFNMQVSTGPINVHRAASVDASLAFPDTYFDWIYIDDNHQYEFVKKDLESYYRKLIKGGYMTGDDYVEGGWWQGGVKKAVNECVANGLVELQQIRNNQFCLKEKINWSEFSRSAG